MPLQEIPHRILGIFQGKFWALNLFSTKPLQDKGTSSQISHLFHAMGCNERVEGTPIQVLGEVLNLSEINFSMDVKSGFVWPDERASRIKYKSETTELDPRWNWELNRLLFLLPLLSTSTSADFVSARKILLSWLSWEQPGWRVHWSAGIEVGIRSIALTFLHSEFKSKGDIEACNLLQKSVAFHTSYLKAHASKYSSANNHRVVELAALLVLSDYWIGFSNRQIVKLEKELATLSEKLFTEAGFYREESPTYSMFTQEFLVLTLFGRSWSNQEYEMRVRKVFSNSLKALESLISTSGELVVFGDDDGGSLYPWLTNPLDFVSRVKKIFNGQQELPKSGIAVFEETSYTVFRQSFQPEISEMLVVFDHGNFGLEPLCAHAHDDGLSVWVVCDGIPIVVEPGTYAYHNNRVTRDYFRARSSHNGPTFAEYLGPSMVGAFNWGGWHPTYVGEIRGKELTTQVIKGWLTNGNSKQQISREIVLSKHKPTILFTDKTSEARTISTFTLSSSLELVKFDKTCALFKVAGSSLACEFISASPDTQVDIEKVPQSVKLGHLSETNAVRISSKETAQISFQIKFSRI